MNAQTLNTPVLSPRKSDDRFANQALVHRGYLMRLAKRLTGENDSAEDLFQETYLRAFKAFSNFEGDSRCRAWLKKIMINTYINMYNRRQKITFFHKDNIELSELSGAVEDNHFHEIELDEENLLHNFVCDEIRRSLLSLPDGYRMTLILFDMLGFSYKEISEILLLPIGTVKSRLFRGRKSLRKSIKGNGGDGNGHVHGACF